MHTRLFVKPLFAIGALIWFQIAIALPPPEKDEVQIGPIEVAQVVQGVPVKIKVASMVSIATSPAGVVVRTRTFGDLTDLQAKIGTLIDTAALPTDNCKSFSANNPVVRIYTKRLDFVGNSVVVALSGEVDVWDCRENPIPNTKIEWVDEKVLGVTIRVPRVVTWPGTPIKNKLLTQPISARLGAHLEIASDSTVRLVMEQPQVELGGNPILSAIRDSLIRLFSIDINRLAEQQLRQTLDPALLQVTLPDELRGYGVKLLKAQFLDVGGLGVEIDARADVAAPNMTALLKVLAEKKK